MRYVYKVTNGIGSIEHIGETKDIVNRWKQHKYRPNDTISGRGKFYQRHDCIMEVLEEGDWTREYSLERQAFWQDHHGIPRDQQNLNRKFDNETVLYIRDSTNKTNQQLADELGCHYNTISTLRARKYYKY